MTKQPWMKWYPADWRADPLLRMCSLTARGLWIEMLGLMHEAEPYGHLLIAGQPPTDVQIAMLAGAHPDQIPELIGELEAAGVFSRNRDLTIYSRRMTRDDKRAKTGRKHAKRRWTQDADNIDEKPRPIGGPNGSPIGVASTQKPEAREEKKDAIASKEKKFDGLAADFGEWWAEAPKKVGKGQAERAYRTARNAADRQTLLGGIARYAAERLGQDVQYTKNPATWLNGKCWLDEPARHRNGGVALPPGWTVGV